MIRALLAEDNPVNREMIHESLAVHGIEVIEAPDGAEAVRLLAAGGIDIALLDLQMPMMDGFEVLRWLKSHPPSAHVPTIAVSAFAMTSDRDRVTAAGFDAYVTKPIDFSHLLREIRRLVPESRKEEKEQ